MANISVQAATSMRRKGRYPKHPFHIRSRPFQLQPFFIAPVLPGETMQNLLMQSRVVSDPVMSKLIGWHAEYYFFYVKHRDLHDRAVLMDMMLDPSTDSSSLDSATNVKHYHVNGTESPAVNWVEMCLTRIVEEFFRNEGETAADAAGIIDGVPISGIGGTITGGNSFLDSAVNDAEIVEAFDMNLASTTAGQGDGTAAVYLSEIDRYMREYEFQRMHKLTEMTYEDWLRSYGVSIPQAEEQNVPELIRYIREWSYPTNHVDPTNGTPTSALSWSIAERADKARFFKEPGFLFGVFCARPKVYLTGIKSNAVQLMANARGWLPAVLSDDPWSSFRKVAAGDPPLTGNTDDYWVDIKDLLLYGDQFFNFDHTTATDINAVSLPTALLSKRFPTSANINAMFVDTDGSNGKNLVRQDGVVSLSILGQQVETSPTATGLRVLS